MSLVSVFAGLPGLDCRYWWQQVPLRLDRMMCTIASMVFRQVIGALAVVTFAATSMLCCCKPSFAAGHDQAANSESGCHGHHSSPEGESKPSSHDKDNCQHCHGGQFLETRDAANAFADPAIQPLFVLPIATVVFSSADQLLSHRLLMPPSRAAPPPLHLLKRTFLI